MAGTKADDESGRGAATAVSAPREEKATARRDQVLIGHPHHEDQRSEVKALRNPHTGLADGLDVQRPTVRGKFLYAGGQKLLVRGVTYGTFRPDEHGSQFPDRQVVELDFAQMAANGLNAVRAYTVPPRWLLDAA